MSKNYKKSLALAGDLFPDEEWIATEPNIWVAKSRLSQRIREPVKWDKEMSQARILTSRGSVAFFLPESEKEQEPNKRHPDTIIDGTIMELKVVSGTIKTLGLEFKRGYKQGKSLLKTNLPVNYPSQSHSVFIQLSSDIKVKAVKAKIAGELKERLDDGNFLCFFEKTGEFYNWSYKDLRAIIGSAK